MSTPTNEYLRARDLVAAQKERDQALLRLRSRAATWLLLAPHEVDIPEAVREARRLEERGMESNTSRLIILLAQDYIEAQQAVDNIVRDLDRMRAEQFHLEYEETAS